MSAFEPLHHDRPADDLATGDGSASAEARHRQKWRTQRLFDLAVTASMAEPWRIARAIGIDERSMRDMRDVPNLGYIARIAQLLGIEPATAAGVVGLGAAAAHRAPADVVALRDDIACADIEDDASALDRLADTLAAAASEPADLALSILCGARADAARGEVAEARKRATCAENMGFSAASAALAAQLLEGVGIEADLGEAWCRLEAPSVPAGTAPRMALLRDPRIPDARSARLAASTLARELILASMHGADGTCERIAALRRHVVAAAELDCPHALAWSASIAAIAALRLRESTHVSAQVERAAMSLFVTAQFAIDERIACEATQPPMSLLRRRLRVALHEWCDRARRGEVSHALLDEFDDSEVRSMFVRFPRARPIGFMRSFDGEIARCIFESHK